MFEFNPNPRFSFLGDSVPWYRGIVCGDAGKSEDEPHGVAPFSGHVRSTLKHMVVGKKVEH